MSKFGLGDVVKLRSGNSPRMTVEDIQQRRDPPCIEVTTVWLDPDRKTSHRMVAREHCFEKCETGGGFG